MTAYTPSPTEFKIKNDRRCKLDLLGMLVVFGLVFFHTARIFAGANFYVMNMPASTTSLMFIIAGILGSVGMALILAGPAFHLIDSAFGHYAGLVVWLVDGISGTYNQRSRESRFRIQLLLESSEQDSS